MTAPALADRLRAALADLASGQADRSSVEATLRAVGRDVQASGTGLAEVVAAFSEAADAAFATARAARREAVGRLLDLQEEERRRLAAEIHDDAMQAMAATYMRMQLFGRKLTSPADRASCEALERMLKQSVERLGRLTLALQPPALDDTTLADALRDYLRHVDFEAPVDVRVVDGLVTQPGDQSRLALYRAAQEALANVARHAAASTVVVALSEDPGGFTLRIEDDGRGFRTPPGQGGLGLPLVRGRVEAIGGSFRVESKPGSGTKVQVRVPR